MIATDQITRETLMDLAHTMYTESLKFFDDPKNNEAFEAWKKERSVNENFFLLRYKSQISV